MSQYYLSDLPQENFKLLLTKSDFIFLFSIILVFTNGKAEILRDELTCRYDQSEREKSYLFCFYAYLHLIHVTCGL